MKRAFDSSVSSKAAISAGQCADVIVTERILLVICRIQETGERYRHADRVRSTPKPFKKTRSGPVCGFVCLPTARWRRVSKRFDPRNVNGGRVFWLNGTVVKSHGAADAKGFPSAIKLAARNYAESEFTLRLAARWPQQKPTKRPKNDKKDAVVNWCRTLPSGTVLSENCKSLKARIDTTDEWIRSRLWNRNAANFVRRRRNHIDEWQLLPPRRAWLRR